MVDLQDFLNTLVVFGKYRIHLLFNDILQGLTCFQFRQ